MIYSETKRRYGVLLYFLVVNLIFGSCSTGYTVVSTATVGTTSLVLGPSSTSQLTIYATPSFIPALSDDRQPTQTHTLIPANSPTPSPTISKDWFTPVPTEMVQSTILDLYKTNAGCRLPCWWGITPGLTSWTEAELRLRPLAFTIKASDYNAQMYYTVYLSVPEDLAPRGLSQQEYRVRDDQIELIESHPLKNSNTSLADLLSTYGEPAEVLISTFDEPREGSLPFYLVLFFPQHSFNAIYESSGTVQGSDIVGCFVDEQPRLALWSPEQEISLSDLYKMNLARFTPDDAKFFKTIGEVSQMDKTAFYQLYKEKAGSSICIRTPAGLWPPPS